MSLIKKSSGRTARTVLAAVGAMGLLLTSACGSGESDENPGGGGDGGGGGKAVSLYVVGGKSDDPFWSRVKRGVDDAARVVKADGGEVVWLGPQNYDNLGPDAAKLINTAISQNADGIIGPNWVPEAQDSAFQRVVDAGIPLMIYNAGGIDAADRLGGINYIGTDDYLAGVAGGEYLGQEGFKNALCVNTLPGATNTEDRCRGLADGFEGSGGKSKQLPMPSANFGNPTAVAQGIKAALLKDTAIDVVVTIGSADATSAASGIDQAGLGDKVRLGQFDVDADALKRIQDGKELFAIDQQPYMQGYLAVSLLNAYVRYGLELPQRPLLTGPAIIDAENVEFAVAGAEAGVR